MPLVKVIGNPITDGIVFTSLDAYKRVEKSQAILALLDGFLELHLDWISLRNYFI